MFSKIAPFRGLGSLHAASVPRPPVHSNDNRPRNRAPSALRRSQRPILVCRWQPAMGGRLECLWIIELVEAPPADEPQRRPTIGRSDRSMNNLKEVGHAHHPRGQVRPRACAALRRTLSLSARELHPAPLGRSLRTARDPTDCFADGPVGGAEPGAISGGPGVRTLAAS